MARMVAAKVNAAIQDSFDLIALESGIARFGAAERTHAVTVLDVVGTDGSLASADDATQEELLAGRAQFLNAQTGPFQILVRAEPVDLEGHLRRVRSRADALAGPLASIAREYVAFVQTLAEQRTLLERHCYVVVPDRTQWAIAREYDAAPVLRQSSAATESLRCHAGANREAPSAARVGTFGHAYVAARPSIDAALPHQSH
jgi:hypothetical protein